MPMPMPMPFLPGEGEILQFADMCPNRNSDFVDVASWFGAEPTANDER